MISIYTRLLLLSLFITALFWQQLAAQSVNTYGHADNVVLRSPPVHNPTQSIHYHISFDSIHPVLDTFYNPNYSKYISTSTKYNYLAVYSDKDGDLKLYGANVPSKVNDSLTNYVFIWNEGGQLIDSLGAHLTQSIHINKGYLWPLVAVPMPGSSDYIYLFKQPRISSGSHQIHTAPRRFRWSLVDLSANNGHGGVVFDSQIFSSDTLYFNAVALTKHANGRDYWLVSKRHQSRKFVAYHIQPGGVVDTVYSEAGRLVLTTLSTQHGRLFDFSPDGRWLADNVAEYHNGDTLQLLNFDASTGIVSDSNARYVPMFNPFDGIGSPNMAGFSADTRYVYVYHQATFGRLYQYDLSTPDQQFFMNSRVLIHDALQGGFSPAYLHTAANQKIYSRSYNLPGWGMGLHSIESPGTYGIACQYQDTSFLIEYYHSTTHDYEFCQFPKFASSWLKEPLDFSYSHVCAGEGTPPTHFAFTDSVVDAFWSFGDTLAMGADTSNLFFPTYHYNHPGDYHVWAKALSYGMWDSISKVITIHPSAQVALGPDTVLTGNDSLVLDAGPDHISYNWSTGDSTRTITLYGNQLSPGDYMYFVEVTDTNGCTGTGSIMVTYEEDTTSIIQKAREPLWEVFPNPCKDNLHIKFPQSMAWGQANLRLYSSEGKLLRKWDIPAHTHHFTLDMSAYSIGIYWLELSTSDTIKRKKVVKVINM